VTLNEQVGAGRLKKQRPDAAEIARLMIAAQRNLDDANAASISDETRFDAGYKSIMQCALVALRASGYRPATSVPGHHRTLIESLSLTLGVAGDDIAVLARCAGSATPATIPAIRSTPSRFARSWRERTNLCA
jgi:hypothetical protein